MAVRMAIRMMMKTQLTIGVTLLGLFAAGLAGCSAKVENKSAPPMSAADLQKKLTDQFAATPIPPKSVSCSDDLAAAVGKTSTCVATFNDTNSIDAVVTVADAKGPALTYDIMPTYTKDQLAKVVAGHAKVSLPIKILRLGERGAHAVEDTAAKLVESFQIYGVVFSTSMAAEIFDRLAG